MYKKSDSSGFSLIELMVVVGIIGLLASVAYPSYTGYVVRGTRVDAMEKLNEIMGQQQRYVLRQRTFSVALTDLGYSANTMLSNDGKYNISAAACAGGTIARCVVLTATPVSGSSQEGDGNITLNSRGVKTWNGQNGWNHRKLGSS